MSNLGLEQALQGRGIDFIRARVGDRYVLEQLQQHEALVGGESSGHIICLDRTTTGDGMVSALQVLAVMVHNRASLHALKKGMSKYPQLMINVPVVTRIDVEASAEIQAAVASAEQRLNGRGRVLLRPSGTEPLIRVMVEGEDAALVREQAEMLAAVVEKAAQTQSASA